MGPYQHDDWEPLPLELPLSDSYGRQQAPEGEQKPEPGEDMGGHVVVIDLT